MLVVRSIQSLTSTGIWYVGSSTFGSIARAMRVLGGFDGVVATFVAFTGALLLVTMIFLVETFPTALCAHAWGEVW